MNPKPIRLIHPAHRVISTLLAGLMTLFSASPALALPQGEQVKHGDVQFERSGNDLLIKQMSSKAIVNYGRFDIGGAESVRFDQPSGNAAILNRVVGGDASTIAGAMLANGHVYLVNPAGILFSSSAQVNVGGLVASAMNLSDENFLSGRLSFSGGGGSVVNQGSIRAGSVALVGGRVENEGVIKAGNILLGAGNESVVIDEVEGGEIRLIIDGQEQGPPTANNPAEPATDTAQASGDSPSAEPAPVTTAPLPDLSDLSDASDAVVPAAQPTLAEQIRQDALTKALVYNKGTLDASGVEGGRVNLAGGIVVQDGTVKADGTEGKGGTLNITANDLVVVTSSSETTANAGTRGDGGSITLFSPGTAILESGATVAARGGALSGNGGQAEVSGQTHVVFRGLVDLSAPSGGAGELLIDPRNVEINATGPTTPGGFSGGVWTPPGLSSVILVTDLLAQLNISDVTITTTGAGGDAGDITLASLLGLDDMTTIDPRTLTLQAHNNININAAISQSGAGPDNTVNLVNLILTANSDSIGGGSVLLAADVNTGGGSFSATGVAFGQSAGTLATGGGLVDLDMTGSVALGGTAINTSGGDISIVGGGAAANFVSSILDTNGGSISMVVGAGTLAINGVVDASGGAGTGAVNLQSTGNALSVAAASTITSGGTGSVTLKGGTALNFSGDIVTNGGNADLDVTLGGVLAVFATGSVNAAGGANSGAITLDTFNGDVAVIAGSTLTSGSAGSVHARTGGAGADLTFNGAALGGSGGVEFLSNDDLLIGGAVSATGGTGGPVTLRADNDSSGAGNLTINALVSSGTTLTLHGQDTTINTTGGLLNFGALTATGGGSFTWNSIGTLNTTSADNITVSGAVTLNADHDLNGIGTALIGGTVASTGSSVTIRGENIDQFNGTISAAGLVTLDADRNADSAGNLTLSGAVTSTAGGISLDGHNTLVNSSATLTRATTLASTGTGSFTWNNAGSITIDTLDSLASAGLITLNADSDANNTGDLTISGLVNSTGGGISLHGQNVLVNNSGSLTRAGALTSTGGGTFTWNNLTDITLNSGDSLSAAGLITLNADSNLNDTGNLTLNGSLAGDGGISLHGFNVVGNAGGTLTAQNNVIQIIGSGSVNFVDDITSNGGDITIDAGTTLAVGNGPVASAGGAITLSSGDSMTLTGPFTTGGGAFNADVTGAGDLSIENDITTAGGIVDITTANGLLSNTAGSTIDASGGAGTGAIRLESLAGAQDLTVNAAVTSGAIGVNLRAGGNVTIGASVNAGGGPLQLVANSDNGFLGNLAVNAAVSTTGSGAVTLGGVDFTQSGSGTIGAAGGNITGTFTGVATVGLAVTSTTGSVGLNAPTLNLDAAISGGGGVTLGGTTINGNAGGTVTAQNNDIQIIGTGAVSIIDDITSNGGDIAIGAGSTLDLGNGTVSSGGGVITLSSVNTMTLSGPFTTGGGAFNADVTGTGALAIQNDITTAGGHVDITTLNGLLSSTAGSDVNALGGAGTAAVRLESLGVGQNLQTLGAVTSGSGGVLLRARDTVTAGGAVIANGGTLTINADTDNNATGNVVLDAPLSTTGGGIISLTGRNFSQNAGGTITGSGALISGDFLGSATIGQAISSNGGTISFLSDAGLTVNAVVSSAPPSGGTGTLRLRGGVTLNAAPVVGNADVTLDGNGLDLIINAATSLGANADLGANRDVIINQAVSTSAGRNLFVTADLNNAVDAATTRGGVLVQGAGSLNSGNHLVVRGAHINDAGGLGEAILLAGLGNTLTASGNLLVTDAGAAPAGADVVIGGHVLSTGGNVNVISARNIAQQGGADITSLGGDLYIDAGGDFSQTSGSFAIVENGGDLFIRSGGAISLESARNFVGGRGDIAIEAAGNISAVNSGNFEIRGDQVSLLATGGAIGAVGNPLQVEANSMALGASGNIVVTAAGFPSLVFDNVPVLAANTLAADGTVSGTTGPGAPVSTGTTGGGSLVAIAQAGGDVTFNSTASVSGAGVLVVEGNNVNINNAVSTAGGTATVVAGNDVAFGASGSLATAGGRVLLDAGNALTMVSGSSVNSGNANIRVVSTDASTLGLLNAGSASISLTAGSFSDANGASPNVIGSSVRLRTNTGGIGSSSDALDLQAGTLALDSAGGVFIGNTGALTVGTVDQVDVSRVDANLASFLSTDPASTSDVVVSGPLVLHTTGDLLLEDGIQANGRAIQVNGGNARVSSGAGLTANAGVTATGDLSVLATGNIDQNSAFTATGAASTLDVEAGGAITMLDGVLGSTIGGNLRYNALGGNLTFASLTAGGSGNLSLIASGSILGTASGLLTGNAARLDAGNGVGSQVFLSANQVQLEVLSLAAQAGAGGISVNDASALIIGSVGPLLVNRVGLDANATPVTDALLSGLDTSSDGNIFAFAAAGSLTVDQAITADGSGEAVLGTTGATSDLVLNAAVNSATGDVVLGAGRDLVINGVTAGTGGAGAIQASATRSIVMNGAARLSNNSGSMFLNAGEGIQLGEVFSTSGNVIAIASGASGFTDVNGSALNLRAASLQLDATSGPMGTGANPIETETSLLAANANGSIFLRNTGALTIGDTPFAGFTSHSASGFPAAFAVGGSSDLRAGGAIVLVNDGGLIVEDGTVVNPGFGATAANGNLLLQDLSGSVTLRSGLSTPGGAITVLAGTGIQVESSQSGSASTYDLQAQGGDLTFQSGLTLATGNANIRLQASGDVVLANVNAGTGNVHVEAGDDIRMAGAGHTVSAAQARFIATDAVGDLSGNAPVATSVDILAASAGAGGIHLIDATAVTVGTTGVFGVNRVDNLGAISGLTDGSLSGHTTTANGSIVQRNSSGNLTVAQAISANGSGNVRLASGAGGNIQVNNTVASGSGNITVFAQGEINQTAAISTGGAGTLDLQGNGGAVNLGSTLASGTGNIRVDASTSVALGSISTSGDVSVEAGTTITDNNGAAVNVSANRVRLDAQAGTVGTGLDALETAAAQLAARGGAGGVFLRNTGTTSVADLSAVTVNRVGPTGATTALADASPLNGISTTANGAAVLVNSGSLTVTGAGVSAQGSGNVLLQELTGDLVLDAPVSTASGTISLIANTDLRQNALVSTGANTIEADAGGSLVQGTGGSTTTSGANIRYRANGPMTVAHLNAGAGNVSLVSNTGPILEDGDAAVDVTAANLRIQTTGPGLAGANALDTSVNTLAATVGTSGLNIANAGALTIGTVNAISVNRVQSDGTVQPGSTDSLLAGINATGGDVDVATVDGNLTVANGVAQTSLVVDDRILLQAHGADRTLIVSAPVTNTGGDSVLRASGTVQANADILGTRNVALWGDDDRNGTGDVNQPSGLIRSAEQNVFIAGENFLQGAAGRVEAPIGGAVITVNTTVNLGSLLTGIDSRNLAVSATRIEIDSLVEVDGTAVLRATSGDIVHTGANPAALLRAGSLGLFSLQNVGSDSRFLEVDAGKLAVGANNLFVHENSSATVVAGAALLTDPLLFPLNRPDGANGGGLENIPLPFLDQAAMLDAFNGIVGADVVKVNVDDDLAAGGLVSAGSLLVLNVGCNLDLDELRVLGEAFVNVGCDMDVQSLAVGNNLTLSVGGFQHGDTAQIGGNLSANVGADVRLTQLNVGGNAVVVSGADFAVGSAVIGGNATVTSGGTAVGALLDVGGDLTLTTARDIRYGAIQVDRNASLRASGSIIGNRLAVGGALNAVTGGDFLVQEVNVRSSADLSVGGRAEGRSLEVGGELNASVRRNLQYDTISVGRNADLDVGGDIKGTELDVRGDLLIQGGGDLTFVSLTSGDADIDVDGDVDVDQIDTDSLDLAAGGSLTFDEINASRVNASIGGLVKMARVNAGSQATFRGGRIQDAGSMVRAGRVSLSASGDVGAPSGKINVDTGNLDLVRGNNVYINNVRGGATVLGLVDARGRAELCVAGSIVDGNGDQPNIIAGSAVIQSTGTIGTARDPIDISIADTLSLVGGQQINSILWGFFKGELGRPPVLFGGPGSSAPGLAILNGSVSLVTPELDAILLSAESYGDDLVGFKFRNSVFGDFYFLHLYLQVSELADDLDLNYIDYILYGRALVTPDPELPPAARNPIYIGGDEGN